MSKKEVKNENINNEVKEEEVVDIQEEEETLDEEVKKESKLKKGITWIKGHKHEIAIGAACVIGGVIGYALGHTDEDNTVTIESGDDYLKIEDNKSEEPVDVTITSEEVSEE